MCGIACSLKTPPSDNKSCFWRNINSPRSSVNCAQLVQATLGLHSHERTIYPKYPICANFRVRPVVQGILKYDANKINANKYVQNPKKWFVARGFCLRWLKANLSNFFVRLISYFLSLKNGLEKKLQPNKRREKEIVKMTNLTRN